MQIEWSYEKNELLKATRNISFEQVKAEIEKGCFIGPEINPTRQGQLRIIVKINNYPYTVPFVITKDGGWFLKTAYPDRKQKWRF